MTDAYTCRVCAASDVVPVLDLGKMPIAHRLLAAPGEAEETFPFELSVCRRCGLMQIVDPIDADLLYRGFNYNFSSWKPEPHRADEIAWIMAQAAPRSVAEIGANDGLFLSELVTAGVGTVAGIEPNPVSGAIARERGLPIYEGLATVELARRIVAEHGSFDAVVSRQVLEHVPGTAEYFAVARELLRPDGYLFIDVPDMQPAAELGDCSVLWEEHATYYTESTLAALLRANGFEPMTVKRYDFSGGALAILSRRVPVFASEPLTDAANVARTEHFAERVRAYSARLIAALACARENGIATVIYGAGVRACTLSNALRLPDLAWAIDDQAERQGKFLPGTHIEIRPSSSLAQAGRPLIVLLAVNNENETKVRDHIARQELRYPVEVVSVCGPRDIWRELERLEAAVSAATSSSASPSGRSVFS
jgi:SAM-dependent methyltransferase